MTLLKYSDLNTASSSHAGTTTASTVTASVSSSGNDATYDQLVSGSYTSPFLTMAGILAAVPRHLSHDVSISVGAGTFAPALIGGFVGGGYASGNYIGLTINGHYTNITPTTGVASGTAGSGTTTTSLVKPTAAANWTASDLIGSFLKITGGGGAGTSIHPVIRPILANTTTSLTIDAVTGMDDTTTFAIVSPDTELDAEQVISSNRAPITLRGLHLSATGVTHLVSTLSNSTVIIDGCLIDGTSVADSIYCLKDSNVSVTNCVFGEDASVKIDQCSPHADLTNLYMDGSGPAFVTDCESVEAHITSINATGYVLKAVSIGSLAAEVSADDGAATPVYLEAVKYCTAVGTNKMTGSGNTGYGIQIESGGLYLLAGSDITGGTGDVLISGSATTWANLNSGTYGSAEANGTSVIVNPSGSKALVSGNKLFLGSVDISGRLLKYGYDNLSSNLVVPTFTASESYNMESNGVRGILECICNSASASVVLPSGCAIAGVIVGVVNRGSQPVTITPPGSGTIDGGASTTVAAGAAKLWVSLNGHGGNDFWTLS